MPWGLAAWGLANVKSWIWRTSQCMFKELTLKLWIYQIFAAFFNIFPANLLTLSRIHPVLSHFARAEKFSQFSPALDASWSWENNQFLSNVHLVTAALSDKATIRVKIVWTHGRYPHISLQIHPSPLYSFVRNCRGSYCTFWKFSPLITFYNEPPL